MIKEIIFEINNIKVNKRNGEYAVYKPLLLLIIFDLISKGHVNEFKFKDMYEQLNELMEKYGWETITNKRAQYPFFFLASSSIWETDIDKEQLKHKYSPSRGELLNSIGKVNPIFYTYLLNN